MTAEHDRETCTDDDIRAERDRALAHVAALEALCAEAAPVVRAVHELLVRTVAAEAARDEALAKVAEVAEIQKEMGDVAIKLASIAAQEGWSLSNIIAARWATVGARDWTTDKIGHGLPEAEVSS